MDTIIATDAVETNQTTPMENPRPARRIQSIGIGVSLLRVIEREPHLALKDIARRVDMPRAKVHLYLATLVAEGLLARDAAGNYALGAYTLQLGLAAVEQCSVVDVSDAAIIRLSQETRHAIQLAVWGNMGPTVVRKVDGANQGPMSVRVGYVLPLLSSATGHVFAAWLPRATTRAVMENEPEYRKMSKAAIDKLLKDTREAGMASTRSQLNSGYAALSAPVFDHEGRICAALTLLDVASCVDVEPHHATARQLLSAAASIGRRLGAPSVA